MENYWFNLVKLDAFPQRRFLEDYSDDVNLPYKATKTTSFP
jgi:hypothetical protein